jgi:hypothetical protein
MFEYTYDPAAENKQVTRNLTGYDISLLKTRLDVNKYLKTLDPTNFTGKDTVSALLFYYSLLQLRTTNNGLIDLDSLSATIHVSMSGEKGGTIGDEDIDVLYFCKKLMETQNVAGAIDHPAAMLANNAGDNAANYERLKELLIQNVFLINKSAFQALSVEFRQATQLNDFQLLLVIAKFAEIRGEGNLGDMTPVLASQLNGLIPETTFQVMIPLVNKFYKKLFDFPILVPEIKQQALEVAGNVHFIVDNGVTISKKDFSHYTLSVEYASEDAGDFGVMYYDWSKNADAVDQNSLKFSLPQTDKIVRYGFPGTVTVVVKDFNGVMVWTHDYKQSDEALKRVQIDIPLERPLELTPQDNNVPDNNVKKLRGQLVALAKECVVDQVTVVIQAKKEGDEIWRIVGAATTDRSGYFFTPYPTGHFLATQALLSINPDKPIDIALNEVPDGDNMPDFLYLLADEADCTPPADTEEDDCECGTVKKPKRLPDQEDLISSDEYTQDMGAGCMNLTTPNRTLREYEHQAIVHLSDPDVANYTLEKYTDKQGNVKYTLTGGATTIKRSIINLQNPIHWQDSPGSGSNLSLYQAVSVATGHILHYKSVFKADGYSLGEVLYSLPLAPGQKKQIVIFDSSHSLTGAESQFITQGESLSANLVNDRAITDQLSGSLAELLSGQSDASTSGVSAGLGAAASMGSFGASLGVAGGYANSNSSASQNSSRDTAQFFAEKLRQSIMQNASSYRQLNANVVTTVREGQQYAATTESVANHNHCHAVTMMYFEVLRHYAIFQELAYVEECVFVPLLMTNFTAQNISKWKDVLAARLLPVPSSTYLQPMLIMGKGRQHPLIRAFDANERILTNYANVEYPTGRYADERMTEIKGQIRIRINIPRPKTRFDRILSFPVIKKTITSQGDVDVAGTISDNIKDSVIGAIVPCAAKGPSIKYQTNSTDVLTRGQIFDAFMTLDANYENVPPAQCIRVNFESVEIFEPPFWGLFFQGDVTQTNMDFFAGMTKEKELWTSYATILGISVKELFKYFNNNVVSDWDRIFNDNIAPMIVEKLVRESTLRFNPLGVLDITPLEKYHGGDRIMTFNLQGFTSLTRAAVDKIQVIFTPNITGSQKDTFFNYVDFNLASLTLNYSTNFSHGTILSSSSVNDLRDNAEFLTPLNSEEKRNPRNEDKVLVRQLLDHLNSNLEYYNKLLWYNLDPDRRFMLLDGFSIQIFDDLGSPGAYRSLASVVKNQLITVTGNSLVFPVASGYKVSPSFITAVNPENGDTEQVSLLDHYKPRTPVPPYRVSVPTRGVYLEAIQGVCDSCEKVKPNSSQDWNKFPVDEPTAILPISTPTPAITDWKAAFKDFAAPMINIQNAPAAPDPGAGLAGLNELLGKSGIFADVTGLQGNQQNALKTYLSNNENVRAMAEMAKGLAMQQHNTQNAQGITDSINQARSTGAISAEDQSRLTREHLQQQIDGGDQARLDAQAAREQSRPSLSDAAIQAAAQGRTVAAQRTDSDGNSESVNITDTAAAASGGINVAYDVPTLQQPSSLLCWATAATMMMNWKNRSSSAIPNVLRDAGLNLTPPDENRYTAMFTANQGLASAQKEQFITALGMLGEAPASYPLQQYVLWLRTYGPLWITTDSSTATGSFSPHAKILKKIVGPADQEDAVQFTFNDPASGNEVTQSFRDFIASYEQMVTDNPGDLFIQIVHFRDAVPAGEGQDGGVSTPARSWMTGVPSTGMTTVKSTMSTQASSEYTYWHDAGTHTGSAWWETDTDTHVVARMTAYWTSAFNTDAEGTATSQVSATDAATKITNRDSWSAAFISYIVSKAGILANTIFSHSIRHVDFIAKAILNKEGRVFSNPFWGYAPGDYAPAVGDIVGRSSQVNYANVVDRSNRQVRRAESHSDVVVEVHDDHIIVIGGNLELDAVHTAFTGGAWHNDITAAAQTNVSVGKRKIYTENGKIKPTGIWEIMNNAGAVQFTGPQSDYFVVIKVRTDVNRT